MIVSGPSVIVHDLDLLQSFSPPQRIKSMTSITAFDALPLVDARRQDQGLKPFPGGLALYQVARGLWNDEYKSYQTLLALGFRDAAECAWQRCKAATHLTIIFSHAM